MAYISIPTLNFKDLSLDISFFDGLSGTDTEAEKEVNNDPYISPSLYNYLTKIKEEIDIYEQHWDYYKKITNPHEYIHTHIFGKNYSVCKYKPLSRAFFKMIEIINIFNFLDEKYDINCFHLAEGPGGFIEAFSYVRQNKQDNYYGMTLISSDVNIPSWKKSQTFLNNNKNVFIENGKSKNGDLFLESNLNYINEKYGSSMEYITGDGGIDFSVDFNNQEEMSLKLIFSQIVYAIIMQKKNGHFVLKIFDIFKFKTVELLFLLSNLYENIYIYKPHTSRVANSEKYIICKYFKANNNNLKNELLKNYKSIIGNIENIKSLFNKTFPNMFVNKIKEINAIYGQQQIENINNTLNLIREYLNLENLDFHNNDLNNKNNSFELNFGKTNHDLSDEEKNESIENKISKKTRDLSYGIIDFNNNVDKYNDTDNDNDNDNIRNKEIDDILYCYSPPSNIHMFENNTKNDDFKLLETNYTIDTRHTIDMRHTIDTSNNKIIKLNIEKFNNKINVLKNLNIQKSVHWCNKYSFTINKNFND